jgi:hypothetical protein
MPADDVDKLKAELHSLNCRIQAERNDEIRHALQRTRLENERAATLVRLIDVQAVSAVTPPAAVPQETLTVVASSPPRRKLKPDGLPPVSAMVVTALHETGKASRPVEIADFVRRRWWSTVPTEIINTTVWHMAKAGKLISRDGYYGLNGIGH